MAIFDRNKQSFSLRDKNEEFEDEDEFNEEEGGGDRKFTKKFRDLNPKNKKKRKEPPKPWGKKERVIVLVILLATVAASAILAIGSMHGGGVHFDLPKFNFDSLNIFKQETIIVGRH